MKKVFLLLIGLTFQLGLTGADSSNPSDIEENKNYRRIPGEVLGKTSRGYE
ncbi:MAG: hypothetical protein LBL04_17595 [Bacteroidales bacterium]|jgi:hypothetical protein|nr:hypothetical protein [Bacteroidales bacterium]